MPRSIVEYCAEHESYRCGYCGSSDTNFSHGMWAHSLTVSDYQDLIDRGWRRSGKYCYKPTMDVTCCPMYTIRCKALEFKATRSQKKILKRVNKYLSSSDPSKLHDERKMSTGSNESTDIFEGLDEGSEQFVESNMLPQDINVSEVLSMDGQNIDTKVGDEADTKTEMDTTKNTNTPIVVKKDSGPDPSKAPCKKAKQLRIERKLQKLKEKGVDVTTLPNNNKNKEKQLEDFINELPDEIKQKLEIKLVRTNPQSAEYLATAAETHQVYVKYQTIIHNDKPLKCCMSKFLDFLVSSPLLEEHSDSGPPCGYGSFHQQYWLSGKLIAVGVIDILPKCVSSVYFFYDPMYMHMNLGTYGALRELEFTRRLHTQCPDLKYYYMGYYIHTCRKMRYKGNFAPSDLLCPETYKWFSIKESIPKLEASPYSRLDGDIDSTDDNFPKEKEINYIPCWVKQQIVPYKTYKRKANVKDNDEVVQYARLVGSQCLKNIILVRA